MAKKQKEIAVVSWEESLNEGPDAVYVNGHGPFPYRQHMSVVFDKDMKPIAPCFCEECREGSG